MKKYAFLLIIIMIFFMLPKSSKAEASTYTVYLLNSANVKNDVTTFDNYNAALEKMNSYDKNIDNVPVIEKDGTIVNAKYALAKFTVNSLSMYDSADLSNKYTGIAAIGYSLDAAFLEYNDANNTVKIKISGYSGWTQISNVRIIPLSQISTNYVYINSNNKYLCSTTTNTSCNVKKMQYNGSYIWIDKKVVDGITWYHISEDGTYGWINSSNTIEQRLPFLNTYYVNLEGTNDLYHYFAYGTGANELYRSISINIKPSWMTQNKYYYSFDGNYFYTDYLTMIDDYKTNSYLNSVNPNNPYYSYYLYLPNHSKTGYTADNFNQIIKNSGYTSGPDPSTTYVKEDGTDWVSGVNKDNISTMYNQGQYFIESQNTYGINALLTFSVALNESGSGTSLISFYKNNIFGHGAYDSCPVTCAVKYNTIRDSILAHARDYSGTYSDPYDYRYFGSHYGNKGSGMNVKYATDPYWGEKMANYAYNRDKNFGGQDLLSNTLGVKTSNINVDIKKSTSDSSDTIYTIKNLFNSIYNVPFIVFDKVYDNNGKGWYKVYTDTALDESQDLTDNYYSFSNSYGYIKEDYLYVDNSQPSISASDQNIFQNREFDILANVTANDIEDGNLTSKITANINSIDTATLGEQFITYTVTDSRNFSVSKTIKVTVNKDNSPLIIASDKEVLQNTSFDPKSSISALDPTDGNITANIIVESNTVDITKVGTYKVIYSVTNSLNIKTTKEVTITVVSNAVPVIRATDIYMNTNDNLTYLENVSATDLEDGIITNNIKVISNVNKLVPGTYDISYEITDSDSNKVTKSIKAYVTNNSYTNKKGELYFNSLNYNTDTNLLEVSGSLAIIGIDNTKDTNITYDLILKNNNNSYEVVLPLERYLVDHPTTIYGDNNFKYLETWFKGVVSLKNVTKGEYTLYVRARSGNNEAKVLFNNIFLKTATKKATDSDGRGYLFRNNNYKKDFTLELFVYENGLISATPSKASANMFNTYSSIELSNKYLKISGNSFNLLGDYSKDANVTRYLILENITSEKRYQFNIGSVVGEELVLKTNDSLSKARSWYNTLETVDITQIPKGRYIIYFRTISGVVDDFGELQDLFLKANNSITINDVKYILYVNQTNRFRVELLIE